MDDAIIQQIACSKCGTPLTADDFYPRKDRPLGRGSWCKGCVNADNAARYKTPEGQERDKSYRQKPKYKEGRNKRNRERYSPEAELSRTLQKRYGITAAEYDCLFDQQRGLCAICLNPPGRGGRLCVDHDHQSGKVRGLLCKPCNSLLGRWRDSPDAADRAKDYLLKHRQLKLVV